MKLDQKSIIDHMKWLPVKIRTHLNHIYSSQAFKKYYKLGLLVAFSTIEIIEIIRDTINNTKSMDDIKYQMIIFSLLIFFGLILIPLIAYHFINLFIFEVIFCCMLCGLYESYYQEQQKILRLCIFFTFLQRHIKDMKQQNIKSVTILVFIIYTQTRYTLQNLSNISQIVEYILLLVSNIFLAFAKYPQFNINNTSNKKLEGTKELIVKQDRRIKISQQLNHQQTNQSSLIQNGIRNNNGTSNNPNKNSNLIGVNESSFLELNSNMNKRQNFSILNYDDHMHSSTTDMNRIYMQNGIKSGIPHLFSSRDTNRHDTVNTQNKKIQSTQQITSNINSINPNQLSYIWQSLNNISVGIILLNSSKQVIFNNKQIKKMVLCSSLFTKGTSNTTIQNNGISNKNGSSFNIMNKLNNNSNPKIQGVLSMLFSLKISTGEYSSQHRLKDSKTSIHSPKKKTKMEKDRENNFYNRASTQVERMLEEQKIKRELQRNFSPKSKQKQDQYGSVIYNQYQSSKNITGNNAHSENLTSSKLNQYRKLTTVEVMSSEEKKDKNKQNIYSGQNNTSDYTSLRNIGFQSSVIFPTTQQAIPQNGVAANNSIMNSLIYNQQSNSHLNLLNSPINSNFNYPQRNNSNIMFPQQKGERNIQSSQQCVLDQTTKKVVQCSIPTNIKRLFSRKDLKVEDVYNFLITYSVNPINQKLNTDNQILSVGSQESNTSLVSINDHNHTKKSVSLKSFKKDKLKDKNQILTSGNRYTKNHNNNDHDGQEVEEESEEIGAEGIAAAHSNTYHQEQLDTDYQKKEDEKNLETYTKGGKSTGRVGQSTAYLNGEKESFYAEVTTTGDNLTGKRSKMDKSSIGRKKMYNYYIQNNYLHIQIEINSEEENTSESMFNHVLELKFSILIEIEEQFEEKLVLIEVQDITKLKETVIDENLDIYKNRILSSVSHELKTPLNCSIQMLDLLLQNDDIPEMLKQIFVTPALNSNYLLLNIINDILDLAQINYGKFTLLFSEFELNKICMECVNLISMQALQKNLDVELDLDPFVPQILNSDQNRIRQVLLNLLSNALKFTQDGKITIRTMLLEENLIQIEIEDTGCGIPQQNLNTIIGMFDKKGSQWQNKYKGNQLNTIGAGLGLTIANNLATGLGANRRLQVQSKENEGSKFSFCIVNHPLSKVGVNFQYKNIFSQEVIKLDYLSENSQKQSIQQQQLLLLQQKQSQQSQYQQQVTQHPYEKFESFSASHKNTNGVPQSLINISIRSKKKNEESQNNIFTSKYNQQIQSLIKFNTEVANNNTSVHNQYSHINNAVNPKIEQSFSILGHNQNSQLEGMKKQKYQLSFKDFSQCEDQGSMYENTLLPHHQAFKYKQNDLSQSRLGQNEFIPTDHIRCESQLSLRKNDNEPQNDNLQRLNSLYSPAHYNKTSKNYESSFSMQSYQEIRNRQNSRGQYQQQQQKNHNISMNRPNSELALHGVQSNLQNQGSLLNNAFDIKNVKNLKQTSQAQEKDAISIRSKKVSLSQYKNKEDFTLSTKKRSPSDQNEDSCNIIQNSDIQIIQSPKCFVDKKVSEKRINDSSEVKPHFLSQSQKFQEYPVHNHPYSGTVGIKIRFQDDMINDMVENDILKDKYLNKEINFFSDSFTQIRESAEWGSMWNKTTEEIKQYNINSASNLRETINDNGTNTNEFDSKLNPPSNTSKRTNKEQKEENIKYILEKQEKKYKLSQVPDAVKNMSTQEGQYPQLSETNKYASSEENSLHLPNLELLQRVSSTDNIEKQTLQEYNKNRKCQCSNVLIVDDYEFNIYALEIRLKMYGFILDKATSGITAIQLVKKKFESSTCCKFYSIILMDLDMPQKNGYETTTDIIHFYLKNKITNYPPISACTAYIQQSDKLKASQVGMKYYITKPINPKILEEVLIQAIIQDPLK